MNKKLRTMKVQSGSLRWTGTAQSVEHAIIQSLSRKLPERPGELLRVHDGLRWRYLAFESALKIAGYEESRGQ